MNKKYPTKKNPIISIVELLRPKFLHFPFIEGRNITQLLHDQITILRNSTTPCNDNGWEDSDKFRDHAIGCGNEGERILKAQRHQGRDLRDR